MKTFGSQFRELGEIFWSFLRIGPVTFGGGYAMIPVIEKEVVEKKAWFSEEEMGEALSLAGSAPGGIGVNLSAFVGYRVAGIKGAVAAVLGITLPTFIIVFLLSLVYMQFANNPKLDAAFQGIQLAIIALILVAALRMWKSAVLDKTTMVTAIATVAILLLFNIHPLLVIVIGGIIGNVFILLKVRFGMQVQFEKKRSEEEAAKSPYKYADYFIADGI
ncbi:chromate transporter [Paenibacillus sp. N1-5-1-14]|uniref:chromate transporter n=1 Tax=Paenibacillus radicibacter TaxID=2972488 RepID=UPI002158BEB8|nr:chromate transporter [Paenibacillus radicibacter]MCR8641670.1 chromate transporter [Paenibacillus radicibacter]